MSAPLSELFLQHKSALDCHVCTPVTLPLSPPGAVLIHPKHRRVRRRDTEPCKQDAGIDLTDFHFFPVPDLPGRSAVVFNVSPGRSCSVHRGQGQRLVRGQCWFATY